MNFPADTKDWKKSERNNKTIAINVLFTPYIKQEIKQAYISKHNSESGHKVILLTHFRPMFPFFIR